MKVNIKLNGLPRRLVLEGLLEEEAALEALTACEAANISFVHYLTQNNLLSAQQIATTAAHEFGTSLYDLSSHNMSLCPKDVVEKKLISKHEVLPLFQRGNRLFVAQSDPTNFQAIKEIRFNTGLSVESILVEQNKLESAIEQFMSAQEDDIGEALGTMDDMHLDDLDVEAVDEEDQGAPAVGDGGDDAPIVRFVNKLLVDAIKKGSSDIHFEPYEKMYRVRFRTDGILEEVTKPPVNLAPRLAARLKVMSQLDISERRIPQDGRIKLKLSKNKAIDFRVNTLPTQFGEKIVLRILDPSSAQVGIEVLGYEDDQKATYMEALHQPQGMILVTGPTGSGKTVSLYTGLNILNTSERNISTAEDPVEINLPGINQVAISQKVGLTFPEALRSFLRQDPDVIMVGEIRDLETAEIAIKAAQTGHMVLSTLHTNSAPETLTRLLNMGVPAFNVATSVSVIIAQRLGRRLCTACKAPADELPPEVLEKEGFNNLGEPGIPEITLYKAVGCPKCNAGYKGRVGIYEVLKMSPDISKIIMEGGNSLQILEQARKENFRTLRQSALRRAAEGIISLEEANRVTKD